MCTCGYSHELMFLKKTQNLTDKQLKLIADLYRNGYYTFADVIVQRRTVNSLIKRGIIIYEYETDQYQLAGFITGFIHLAYTPDYVLGRLDAYRQKPENE